MAYLYRFEDDNGEGIFRRRIYYSSYNDSVFEEEGEACYRDAHSMTSPYCREEEGSPLADSFRGCLNKEDFLFAFASKEQVMVALPSMRGRQAMHDTGCKLRLIEIPDEVVKHGNTQSIFKHGGGYSVVATLDPITFEEE